MAGGLAGCGGGEEPTEPTTTVSPRTPVGQGKTNEASQGKTSDASGSESSSESTGKSSSSTSGEGGGGSDSSAGAGELPEDLPAVATKRTKEGAAAFGKAYQNEVGEASKSGDPSRLEKMATSKCPPCTQVVQDIRKDAEKGRVRSENPYSVSGLQATKRPDSGYKVSMDVDVAKHRGLEDGKPYGTIDATQFHLTEHVIWRGGRWQVADWVVS